MSRTEPTPDPDEAPPGAPEPRARVFDARHRSLSAGILLGVTLTAFEGLAIVTVAPEIADALGGLALYGWIFSGFLLASLFGTVLGGSLADRRGPAPVLAAALTAFVAGSLVAGFAPAMPLLIAGRVLQGLGGGALVTALYTAVTLAYPDALRPRLLAYMSTAWVLPALVGPSAAGAVAELATWRWVFWAMVPLAGLAAALTLPPFRRLGREPRARTAPRAAPRWGRALLLVLGTGAALAALGAAERRPLSALAALPTGAVALVALARLLPGGTLRLARGLPAAVAGRGLLFAGFIGVEAFLALALTRVQGLPASLVGVVIAAGSISWTAGAWLQDRLDGGALPRSVRVAIGALLLSAGLALQIVALFVPAGGLALGVAGWALAGLGIGSAHAAVTALAFAAADEGAEGRVASALQLSDQFTAAVATGVGGTLLAVARLEGGPLSEVAGGAFAGIEGGVALAFGVGVLLALAGSAAALRIAPQRPERRDAERARDRAAER